MTDLAKYIRIFNADPDDEYTTKRLTAIKAIKDAYLKKSQIDDLTGIANDIISSVYDVSLLGSVVKEMTSKALKKQSSSFIEEGEELQMSVCGLSAALHYIEEIKPGATAALPTGTVLSISLWSGLSFVDVSTAPKLNQLKQDVVLAAQNVTFSRALTTRNRAVVSIPSEIGAADGTSLQQLAAAVQKAFSGFVLPMRTNAVLDREEIDVLWWVLNGWSNILEVSLKELNDSQKAIFSAFELTGLLRRLPSHVHRRLVLKEVDPSLSLTSAELLEQLGNQTDKLKTFFDGSALVKNNPKVFPLSTLIINGADDSACHQLKRTLDEWCGRAIIEGAIMNISKYSSETL